MNQDKENNIYYSDAITAENNSYELVLYHNYNCTKSMQKRMKNYGETANPAKPIKFIEAE